MSDVKLPEQTADMYCHAIYSTWHIVNRAYKSQLAPLGLTYPQYITLTLLWDKDGRTVGEIAVSLAMESNTLTPLLKRLEADGYLLRKRSAEDERQVRISLTPKGKSLRSKAREITACMIEATGLTEDQLNSLVGSLKTIGQNLSPDR
ncbi:MAG: MarR family transcriptional regulator [Pseudomonadota bacterium]